MKFFCDEPSLYPTAERFETTLARQAMIPRSIGHRKSRLARAMDWLNRHDIVSYIVCLVLGGACLYFAVALGMQYAAGN